MKPNDYDQNKDYTKGERWIGVDLDGTLAKYDGWKGEDVIGDPVPGARELLVGLKARGFKIALWTSRMGGQNLFIRTDERDVKILGVLIEWLKKWHLDQYIDEIVPGKPIFYLTIDDRTIVPQKGFENLNHVLVEVDRWLDNV